MEVLQARIDSFKKARRVKNPNKQSSTITVRWPHPLNFKANPETLGAAGFFYNPSYDGPDSVTCYFCEKGLEGWEEHDDPHVIHWEKCSQTCCWAIVRCGLLNDRDRSSRFVFTDKTRVPTHKLMEKARFDTFDVGNGWIHDQVKNHSANSKMMARAGFVYTPQQSNDDLVTCLYCGTSLSGWAADDDPMEEHRRRKKSCPFFSASEPALTNRTGSQSQSSKPPSKSKPPTRSTSKSKQQDILLPTKTHDGDLDNDSDSSRTIAAAKVRSRSKSVTRSEPEESNAEDEIQKKTLRSRSKKKAEDSEDVPRKSSRSKAKASKGHEVPPKPSRTRSKTPIVSKEAPAQSQHQTQTAADLFNDDTVIDIVPLSPPSPARRKMNVVEISSDEEPGQVTEPEKIKPVAQFKKENTHGSTTAQVTSQPEPQPEVRIVFSQSRKVKRSLTVEVVQPNNPLPSVPMVSPIREVDNTEPESETNNHVYPAPSPQRSLPPTLPSIPTGSILEIDAVGDIEPEPELETNNHVYPAPSTPQRSLPQTPPKKVLSATVELIPALSKLPSIPLHTLTEAELDMTVEEWIRYQMDVEYDKFRRDGERELQRFRNQAEKVRKAIEGL